MLINISVLILYLLSFILHIFKIKIMPNKILKTYTEFYAFYLNEHKNKTCRILHFVGTTLVFITTGIAIYINTWQLWIAIPIIGYSFAWVGHFFFEKNKPAIFKHPFWSLYSDFKMFFELLVGKIRF